MSDQPEYPTEPQDCRRLAEDTAQPEAERLIWAVLAVAGELHELRRLLRKR
ncbi:hypothetical protein [Streptomyces sp. DH8]|uniref:hypothetical protein n=1 Tax=Streptomyces sp. DH8 TaxID=2857008 RepID=UPI001E31F87E|nr:hypothetical protein [Streptomyces sp. DH8]